MFNILLMPVSVITYWEATLLGMVLFILKDLSEIRGQILEEMRVEKIDSEYKEAMKKWKEMEKRKKY